ncbi:hypothetical protein WICPIJ_010086 [Wickerhamomyces pijperi]|uniref:Uncharacterized protein n=1 Tax=Wickerhamomyces pijperi TaxID=599730 RepID=A0A9P8PIZ2_WICPI|nr:hypothetical protein WICPIJ_010086 [Wickerhamomyces pijperi]
MYLESNVSWLINLTKKVFKLSKFFNSALEANTVVKYQLVMSSTSAAANWCSSETKLMMATTASMEAFLSVVICLTAAET